jgi:hypothetical protein
MDEAQAEISYFSFAYLFGAAIMLGGVILPFGYMIMQNNKSLKARMTK